MKTLDPINQKVLDFAPATVFTVYTRRSNCRKRIIYTGKDIEQALKVFHGYKVFRRDYKYLTYLENGEEHQLYRNVGEGDRVSYQGKRMGPNHTTKRLQIESTPITLWEEFTKKLKQFNKETKRNYTPSKVLPLLMAQINAMPVAEMDELLNSHASEVIRHTILSGGDNTAAIKEYLVTEGKPTEVAAEELL